MRSFICLVALGLCGGVLARCEWYLEANDCICMNSTDGSLARTQTVTCCKATGYKTTDNICGVDKENRQNFKDCCKGLNQQSIIGHCR
ncbi:hypothetical protein V8F33_009663 [Rhypophila sp. PSN 637]